MSALYHQRAASSTAPPRERLRPCDERCGSDQGGSRQRLKLVVDSQRTPRAGSVRRPPLQSCDSDSPPQDRRPRKAEAAGSSAARAIGGRPHRCRARDAARRWPGLVVGGVVRPQQSHGSCVWWPLQRRGGHLQIPRAGPFVVAGIQRHWARSRSRLGDRRLGPCRARARRRPLEGQGAFVGWRRARGHWGEEGLGHLAGELVA